MYKYVTKKSVREEIKEMKKVLKDFKNGIVSEEIYKKFLTNEPDIKFNDPDYINEVLYLMIDYNHIDSEYGLMYYKNDAGGFKSRKHYLLMPKKDIMEYIKQMNDSETHHNDLDLKMVSVERDYWKLTTRIMWVIVMTIIVATIYLIK